MRTKQLLVAVAAGVLALTGCQTNDDMLAQRDRELGEKIAENEALRKRLSDGESVRMVMQKELDQAQSEAGRARREAAQAADARDALARDMEDLRNRERDAGDVTRNLAPGLDMVTRAGGEVVLRLDNAVTFGSGSANLSNDGQRLLRENVAEVLGQHGAARISVEGHTDDTPIKRSRWKTNLNLSIARAMEVRRFLTEAVHVPDERLRVVGYGETRPLVENSTDQNRARNRRVEIVLYREPADN